MAKTGRLEMTFSIRDMPDVLWEMRRELARVLRDEADAEADPRVARRLHDVADAFEAGARREP